ncbi:MAG: nucleotidyltransferase domain-containing protein [Coriobacteriales bacterium]|jgi:predicted nucleotidyltransferase|nr:nucleotidyltransferase domain-containing protein [Coriobacteriales bacterium]
MCDEHKLKMITNEVSRFSKRTYGKHLKDVILYGSYARGEQEDDSDIDIMILVDMNPAEIKGSGRALTKLSSDLGLAYDVVVSPTVKDYKTFEAWREALPYYRNIDREGIRIDA